MKIHEVKTWPIFFGDVWRGAKTVEIRDNDRGYEPGDYLIQREYDQHEGAYSGRIVYQTITYVIRGPVFGLSEGWAVLSTVIVGRTDADGVGHPPADARANANLAGIKDLKI
jgi:hypothetical protein